MINTLVHAVVGIHNYILVIYYTETDCWQFRVISYGGVVFGQSKLYFAPEAAEKAGREWIMTGN